MPFSEKSFNFNFRIYQNLIYLQNAVSLPFQKAL